MIFCKNFLKIFRFFKDFFIFFKGLIDVGKEKGKLAEKEQKLRQQLEKLRETMAKPDYESKVPEEIRNGNSQKFQQIEGEIGHLLGAIQALSTMD